MYHKPLDMLVTVVVTLMSFQGVATQTSDVVCPSFFGWANNQLDQNPCIVASYLEGVCNGGEWDISPLVPNSHYLGPTDGTNTCQCNSVVYSLISACAACQGQIWISWDSWVANCSLAYFDQYPNPIPQGTLIPTWAYLDVTAVGGGTFSVTAAQQNLSVTASSATLSQLSQSTASIPTTLSSSPEPSSFHAGAIVGGVVGGIAALSIIATGIVWFMRRRARSTDRENSSFNSYPMGQTMSPYGPYDPVQARTPAPAAKIYDPDDPSTFPHSPGPSVTYTPNASGLFTSSLALSPESQALSHPE